MIIDIQSAKGFWWVIAHTPSGDAHDAFGTKAEAVAFAQSFYGGQLVVMGAVA
jgi:hypothetical protein